VEQAPFCTLTPGLKIGVHFKTTDAASISNEVAKLLEGVVIPYFGSWGPGKRPLFTAAW